MNNDKIINGKKTMTNEMEIIFVGYNLHNPLQAGTSAIPSKHTALLPIPTCAERDQTTPKSASEVCCHCQFCMDLHSAQS